MVLEKRAFYEYIFEYILQLKIGYVILKLVLFDNFTE